MRSLTKRRQRYGLVEFVRRLVRRYFDDNVGGTAAMLTYYFIFSLFPLILLATTIIGFLNLSPDAITAGLSRFIPDEILDIVTSFVVHVTEERSSSVLVFGLVFSFYFPARAVYSLLKAVSRAYRTGEETKLWKRWAIVLGYTVFLMVALFAALLLITIGSGLLTWMSQTVAISPAFIRAWSYLRFLFLGALLFVVLSVLYRIPLDRSAPLSHVLPGALAALVTWLAFSLGFSFYVENLAHYATLYGSIGAIIVLLLWLYFSAMVLVMGAECNHVLITLREDRRSIDPKN